MRTAHMPWGDPALDISGPDGYLLRFVAMLHRTPDELLALLTRGTDAQDAALAGLDEHDYDLARAPGEWTIRQIVAHLVDGDTLSLLPNIKMALAEPGRTRVGSRWNQDIWSRALYAHLVVAPSLALLRANRAYLTALFATQQEPWDRFVLLRAEDAEATGRQISVREELFNIASHTFEHVEVIRQTRQAHGC